MSEQNNGGFFSSASPKLTFIFGLVAGLAVVSFIGFIVLLVGNFRGGKEKTVALAPSPTAQVPPPAGGPTPTPSDAQNAEPPVGDFRQIDLASDHIRGDQNAKVSIIEYSDLECPFCKGFHATMRETLDAYQGKVNWVYRHFPLSQLHSKAPKEAEATECAFAQGGHDAFWKFVDRIFAITPSNDGLDPAELPKIAAAIGLNQKKFETCLSSGEQRAKVQADANDASIAGARGTPYSVIVVGDQKIPVSGAVPVSQLKQMLDSVVR
ncbi:thioredoxin domain-containing protein [Candidatus Uhrbacteria bacterium]|nr:thioredoxin domain-containing protein [Candidatus Uhrbacteria bacterium]